MRDALKWELGGEKKASAERKTKKKIRQCHWLGKGGDEEDKMTR